MRFLPSDSLGCYDAHFPLRCLLVRADPVTHIIPNVVSAIIFPISHPNKHGVIAIGYLRLHGALLVRLAQALETTPDEILAATPASVAAEPPIDRRFLRRLKQVEKLSPHQKKLLLGTIDAFLTKVS